ncbi:MAG: hypothetical protein JST09_06730 [Bacteroidetes bacterium]|nr:hypothetical protein [Bacteroidota bacterium]MBS1610154.1 hypothetical protein [Bacteroidota bacterium]
MKKAIATRLCTILTGLVVCFNAFSQDSSTIKSLPPVKITASLRKIPNSIWKGFSTYFNDAENPRWFRLNKDYLVKFMIYDEENRALFSKKGTLIYHISYGYEKSLPPDLLDQIKNNYREYEITRAIKITGSGRLVWIINLEDEKNIILLRMEDGEMEEAERLKKTS